MMTSTDQFAPEVLARARVAAVDAPTRGGRVWRAPVPGRYAAGLLTAALIAGGAATIVRLDDGPPAVPESVPGSMHAVVDQIGARDLWQRGITGAGVNVAVIDTGVAPVAALATPGKVIAAVDLSSEHADQSVAAVDTYGHGTHMAGIIAGRDPDADPALAEQHPDWFLGVAPDAGIVSVKVAGRDGGVDPAQVIAGIDWVVANAERLDVDVITVAFDSGLRSAYQSDPLAAAVERAWDAGIVVVAAAGNDGLESQALSSPAHDPYVIAVGGVEATGDGFLVPEWASAGDGVRNPDLAAPGAHIRSLRAPGSTADLEHPEGFVDEQLFLGSGSSQAAAVAAGAVALMLSADPSLTPDQVKQALTSSAADLADAPVEQVGAGIIDVDAAVRVTPGSLEQTWQRARGAAVPAAYLAHFDAPDAWTGSSWMGSSWMGSSWMGSSWMGSSWMGSSWMGSSWT
jgi:serine protease AprX